MNCEWGPGNILLYVYGETDGDFRTEVEQHTARCEDCAAELIKIREFQSALPVISAGEPSPNLLAAARLRLDQSLETAARGGFWSRLTFDPAAWMRQLRDSPALAAAIFVVGFAGGVGATYQVASHHNSPSAKVEEAQVQPQEAAVTGIKSVQQEPGSDRININYETVSAKQAQGPLEDQQIQNLLVYAARNTNNSGVRLNSVNLLTQKPPDQKVREALMFALRYDSNPAVRLKALGALKSYVKGDIRVRDAVLEALLNDPSAELRAEALNCVQPVRADSSVRAALHRLAHKDDNQSIRLQATNDLAAIPRID